MRLQYAHWAGLEDWSDFYWSPVARGLYQRHLAAMTGRVNTVTGVAYRDDPTIFAWDLMNEPRCNCFPPSINPGCAESAAPRLPARMR